MKTLDEVIEVLQYWDTYDEYPESFYDFEVVRDALHYLKAYRENQHAYEEGNRKAEEARERYLEAVKNCELAENKYKRLYGGTSQKLRNTSQITCPKCHSEFVILPESNEPLSWDELRTMEGKPVWVVPEAEKGYWFVIEFFNNNPYYGGDRVCFTNDVMLNRCDLGKTWQAYRKERTDGQQD